MVVGRHKDPRRRGRFHTGCGGVDFGCNEFAGWFTAFTEESFAELDADAVAAAMRDCSAATGMDLDFGAGSARANPRL